MSHWVWNQSEGSDYGRPMFTGSRPTFLLHLISSPLSLCSRFSGLSSAPPLDHSFGTFCPFCLGSSFSALPQKNGPPSTTQTEADQRLISVSSQSTAGSGADRPAASFKSNSPSQSEDREAELQHCKWLIALCNQVSPQANPIILHWLSSRLHSSRTS